MASNKFLEETGLSRLWANTKSYVNDTFSHGFGGGENLLTRSENTINLLGTDNSTTSKRENGKITVLSDGDWNAYNGVTDKLTVPIGTLTSNVGNTFTVSVDVKTTGTVTDDNHIWLQCGGTSGWDSGYKGKLDKTKSEVWYRVSATMTVKQTDKQYIYFGMEGKNNNGLIIEYRNWKLERGAIATPWSLAPSELLVEFNDYQILSGMTTTETKSPMQIQNFPTHQILTMKLWLANINFTAGWQSKQAISIPLKYLRFKSNVIVSEVANEFFDNAETLGAYMNAQTGIITVTNRNKTISSAGTSMLKQFLIYDSKMI